MRLILALSLAFLFLFAFSSVAFAQVVINEISPSEEWVELFNTSSQDVNLNSCVLNMGNAGQDVIFSSEDTILALGYKVAEKNVSAGWTSNWLNNSGDSVTLDCLGSSESVTYGSDVNSKTYGRDPNGTGGFVILESSTKGAANSGPQPLPTSTPTPTPTLTPTAKPTPTPKPTITPTPTPTPKPKSTPKPQIKAEKTEEALKLGLTTESSTPTPTPPQETVPGNLARWVIPFLLVTTGTGLLILATFPFVKEFLARYNEVREQDRGEGT